MRILHYIFKLIIIIILFVGVILALITYREYIKIKPDIENGCIEKSVEKLMQKKHYTKLEDVDKKYIKALVSAEDHRFYNHGPVDMKAIFRAVKINIKNKAVIEGGSSITQQLAKNLLLNQKQTFSRKFQELIYSIELEKKYSKDEIIEMYYNISYFGSGYYTLYDASMGYFGKPPKELTLAEAAFLAGVPNAPSVYDPRVNYQKAVQRRNLVLNKMVQYGAITQEEANKASEEKLEVLKMKKDKE